jgi:hypothetical protein
MLLLLPLAKMMSHGGYELLDRNVEGIADPQQRKDGDRAASLHHLPVADAEAVRNHVLLAEFARSPASPDFVTEATKEAGVMGREFSACPHISKLAGHEQKHHEQKCVSRVRV